MDKLVSGGTPGLKPKPLAHHDFRPDINGLRALAVLGVVAFHASRGLLPGGFAGVDVFFVISGFLITRIILSEREAQKFSLLFFYAKRAKRILPALLVVTAFVWGVGWLWADPRLFREIGGHIEGSSYFTVNLWLLRAAAIGGYFGMDSATKPLLHLWSLSIEEQFYLFWPATVLLLFAARRRFIGSGVAVILALSLAFCLYETPNDPSAAFYLLWSRAWELALGALLAWREVFILHRAPHPERPWADVGAGLGVALICASYLLLDESQAFPGWRALAPALGGALVIAFPGSRVGAYVLGNRIAQFFGLISYPLYLWHWPLFAFSRIRPGVTPDGATMAALSALAVLLAILTWRFIERPVGHVFRRRPRTVALILVALLAGSGVLGSATRRADGFPGRFPPFVARIFAFARSGAENPRLNACFYDRDSRRYPLDEERRRAAAFFESNHCGAIADPRKPTIMVVGDSHAGVLFAGLEREYGARANIIAMTATYCIPLIENTPMDLGVDGTPRCHAINEYIFRQIRAIKPDILIVGDYFVLYTEDRDWIYPNYFNELIANLRRLHDDGVKNIVVAGEVPTWAPFMPIIVGLDVEAGRTPAEFSAVGLRPESLAAEARLKQLDWGPGVTYVSQVAKLCHDGACRQLVGDKLPEDMIAMDYGHYSFDGSIFAVKTIFAPVIDPILARAKKD
ncbi:acyltransferase family protein [Rhodoblastus sp.]|uniref:acyltransferase family protein n=2 Tax=Rhodoblastus sp. TaxID=1962975 RepID=UPI003F94EA2C